MHIALRKRPENLFRILAVLSLLALRAFAPTSSFAEAQAGVLGFPLALDEILWLEKLNLSVRYDSAETIQRDWGGSYDRIAAVELASVENRYALFENDSLRRADIAIRGTTNMRNALFDAEFLKTRSPQLGILLHTGFERVALAVYADLRPRLGAGYSIRIAGHSLGAAEAIILGMLLKRDGYPVRVVLASAPPKVTDAEGWAAFHDLPVMRVVGPFDPVPFLPPRSLLYGRLPYEQGGPLLMILDGRKATVQEPGFFDNLPDALRVALAEGRHFDVADHALRTYMKRLLPKQEGVEEVDPLSWADWAMPAGK